MSAKEKKIKAGILLKGVVDDVDAAIQQVQQIPGVEVIYVRKATCALEIKVKDAK